MNCIDKVLSEKEIDDLLKENQQLKEQLNKYTDPKDLTLMFMYCDEKAKDKIKCLEQENQKLKKQLEEWEQYLINAKEMLNLQGHDGNYNYDNYMLGLYNGMEYVIALFEKRNPIYKDGKDIKFLSDKNQQKEFIKYLENKISELNEITKNEEDEETIHYALVRITAINEILLTYKKIIGGKE